MDCGFDVISKSHRQSQGHLHIPLCYPSSFMVLHFTFRALIHLEFIVVTGVRSMSRFMFYTWLSSGSSTVG